MEPKITWAPAPLEAKEVLDSILQTNLIEMTNINSEMTLTHIYNNILICTYTNRDLAASVAESDAVRPVNT